MKELTLLNTANLNTLIKGTGDHRISFQNTSKSNRCSLVYYKKEEGIVCHNYLVY